jgi:hypothetical protein
MKSSKYILAALLLSACWLPVHAQLYLDGLNNYNNGGIVAYYDNAIVTSSGNYTAVAAALTVHGGITLQVDGPYTASGNAVDSFIGDGSAVWPPVDAAKTISGTVAPSFDIAKLMNGATQQVNITNTQGINVGQRIDFANGITTTVRSNTQTGAVRLLDNATYTNTALGDAQHVNGYVSKTGNDAFTFPVGSGTDLRTLAISAPATATDQYSVSWIAGDPGTNGDPSNGNAMHATTAVTGAISVVSTAGQWDWVPVSGTGAGLTVTVSIPAGITAPATNLRLAGWNGTSWIDLSGSPNATGNTEGSTLSGTMVSGIQAIAVGRVAPDLTPTLDIDGLSFSPTSTGRDFVVNVFEINNVLALNPITVRLPKLSAFTITYATTSGTSNVFGGIPNQNSNWSFTENASFITATALPGVNIPANGGAVLGFTVARKPGIIDGTTQNLTPTITGLSGGEVKTNNNNVTTSFTATP